MSGPGSISLDLDGYFQGFQRIEGDQPGDQLIAHLFAEKGSDALVCPDKDFFCLYTAIGVIPGFPKDINRRAPVCNPALDFHGTFPLEAGYCRD